MNHYPIAVLISVYKNDSLHQFEVAVKSIRDQDYGAQYIRIYLGVDGPVPKELDAYIEENPNHFYRVIRNGTNQGLAATLNHLIDSLEDEKYVFRMDADDIALPYRCRLQVDYMERNPNVDVCGGSIVEFDDAGNAVMFRNYPENTALAKQYICKSPPLAHVTVCFRRSLFEHGKYRYPPVKSSQDIRLWHRVLADGKKIGSIQFPVVLVRLNTSMLKRRRIAYGFREFGAFWVATYSIHGFNWRLIYPVARLMTRFAPSWLNRIFYRKLRWLLNSSSRGMGLASSKPVQCIDDKVANLDLTGITRRVLEEFCGLSEEEVDRILLEPSTIVRRAA